MSHCTFVNKHCCFYAYVSMLVDTYINLLVQYSTPSYIEKTNINDSPFLISFH